MKAQHFFYSLAIIATLFTACKKPNNEITYPAKGLYGANILSDQVMVVSDTTGYSMKAEVPKNSNLTIVLKNGLRMYKKTCYEIYRNISSTYFIPNLSIHL